MILQPWVSADENGHSNVTDVAKCKSILQDFILGVTLQSAIWFFQGSSQGISAVWLSFCILTRKFCCVRFVVCIHIIMLLTRTTK